MTEPRISQIIKQTVAGIPEEDRTQVVKLRRSYLDQAKRIAMEMAQARQAEFRSERQAACGPGDR